MEPAEVLVPLDRSAAEKLDGRIRRLAKQAGDQLVQVGRLLDEAKSGRIHEALGFASWTAYVADSLGGTLQLSGAARQAMVELMAGEGMSVRAIAAATGVSKSTVSNDLAQASNHATPETDSADSGVQPLDTSPETPAAVTGIDGKTYAKPKRKPRPKKGPVKPEPAAKKEQKPDARRVGIPTAYRRAIKQLNTLTVDLLDLSDDPRWAKARERFSDKDRAELDGNIATLQALRSAIGERCTATAGNGETAEANR
ncbi:hypothetical protein [Mycolicibacterium pulveris]|uniref:hypothetical protein n=1 Tax=Mycolicibacterium pulveris TaxID=36813 RepID=UPI003CFA1B7B